MGRASRRKGKRRGRGGLELPSNVPASIRNLGRVRRSDPSSKVSEALAELVRPFVEEGMSFEDFRGLVGIGAVAWNISLLDGPILDRIADLLKDQDDDYRAWFEAFVSDLVDRTVSLFPRDDRFLAGWDVSLRPDGSYFLTAAAVGVE